MKKKKIIITVVVLLLLSYFLYGRLFSSNTNDDLTMIGIDKIIKVEKKSFDSNIEVNGTTKIKNEQKLRFNKTGRVTDVKFLVGDKVYMGETIAEIDTSEALNDIEKVKINLNNSKTKLNNFLDNLNDTGLKKSVLDIEKSISQIINKEGELELLREKQNNDLYKKELELKTEANNYKILEKEIGKNILSLNLTEEDRVEIVKEKQLLLSKQELEYNKFKKEFDVNLEKKINEYYNKLEENYYIIKNNIINSQRNLKEVDKILGINEDTFIYYDYFSAKDVSNRNNAITYFKKSENELNNLKEGFDSIKDKKDFNNIIKVLKLDKNYNEQFYILANYMVKGFESSISSVDFSDGHISGYSSNYLSMMNSSKSNITTATSNIDNLKIIDGIEKITADLKDELELKENEIEKFKIDISRIENNQDFIVDTSKYSINIENLKLEKSKTNLETQVLELKNFKINQTEELKQEVIGLERLKLELEENKKRKDELESLNTNQEYVFLKNDVKQSEVNLKDAYKKLENYIIQAPFNGIITKIDIKPGDRLNSDTQKFISIVDPNTIEVKTEINQSDIVKLKKGAVASLELGAYPEKSFTGVVSEIETTPKDVNGVSKFETKILLNNPENLKLYSGMKALVKIKYDTIPESLVVPFTSVNTDDSGNKFVTIIKDGEKEKRIIEVGFTDGKDYQIISGVKENEEVLEIDYNSDLFKGNMFGSMDEEEF